MKLQTLCRLSLTGLVLVASAAWGQFPMRPPTFSGGVPGLVQMQAISLQRHQTRTALYREALEALRKNPQAADIGECPAGQKPERTGACLYSPEAPAAPASSDETPTVPGRRRALLIGNNAYAAPIPALETPIADVEAIGQLLRQRFGYEVQVVHNAGKGQIIDAFNQIAGDARPEDSILLIYAGHGYLMDDIRMGFWIPIDGSVKSPANWISNSDISKLLKAIPSRQIILISDSCFSGSLTKEQKFNSADAQPDEIRSRRSVMAFSSGDEEPVSDEGKEGHSIFAYTLIKTLESAQGLTPGYQIYRVVQGKVSKEYEQSPQYGAVISAGHASGGDFLLEAQDK